MASIESFTERGKLFLKNSARVGISLGILSLNACATTTSASEVPQYDPVAKTLIFDGFRLSRSDRWIEATKAPDKAGMNVSGIIKFLDSRGCKVEDIIPVPGYTDPVGVYYKLVNRDCIKELNQE